MKHLIALTVILALTACDDPVEVNTRLEKNLPAQCKLIVPAAASYYRQISCKNVDIDVYSICDINAAGDAIDCGDTSATNVRIYANPVR